MLFRRADVPGQEFADAIDEHRHRRVACPQLSAAITWAAIASTSGRDSPAALPTQSAIPGA
jgi:hypothetical protein